MGSFMTNESMAIRRCQAGRVCDPESSAHVFRRGRRMLRARRAVILDSRQCRRVHQLREAGIFCIHTLGEGLLKAEPLERK